MKCWIKYSFARVTLLTCFESLNVIILVLQYTHISLVLNMLLNGVTYKTFISL